MLAVFAALGVIILASSFGTKNENAIEESSIVTHLWQVIDHGADIADRTNYEPYTGTMPPNCQGSDAVCVISAPEDEDGFPNIDFVTDLKSDLETFRDSGIPSNQSNAVDYKPL